MNNYIEKGENKIIFKVIKEKKLYLTAINSLAVLKFLDLFPKEELVSYGYLVDYYKKKYISESTLKRRLNLCVKLKIIGKPSRGMYKLIPDSYKAITVEE